MDFTTQIVEALSILQQRDLAINKPFQARAYQTVIKQLKEKQKLGQPVRTFADLQDVKGLGEKIQKKIKEIFETGQLQSAEKAKEVYHTESLKAFQNIYGVGPVKAKELVDQGFRTIEDLRDAIRNPENTNDLSPVRGVGTGNAIASPLNEKQLIGLHYYEDLLERIPREEMDEHKQLLHEYLPSELVFDSEIVGSYRRGLASSGDIDMLIKASPVKSIIRNIQHLFTEFVDDLKEEGYIKHILALGPHKCMAICQLEGKLARRLDLLLVPQEEYAYSMLYFTGSDRFNVAFRQYCLSKGYTLNEHGLTALARGPSAQAASPPGEHALTRINDAVAVVPPMETEQDIFRFVGLRYIAPSDRVDSNQIIPLRTRQQVAK